MAGYLWIRIVFKKMPHNEFYGGFIDVVVLPSLREMGEAGQWLVYGGHLKGRKINHVVMSHGKLVGRRPQGGF